MASKFDGRTKDGIYYTVLRGKDGKARKRANGRELRSYCGGTGTRTARASR
jgi:hypothetical protein